jgi:hypothetical protein
MEKNTIVFRKIDAKRTEVSFIGIDDKTVTDHKYEGNALIVMPNRSIEKDAEKVTIYLDLSGVNLKQVLLSCAENWKTRITQQELAKLTEKERAQIFKDGYWHVKVQDWFAEKGEDKTKSNLEKASSALNKLTAEERDALIASYLADKTEEVDKK